MYRAQSRYVKAISTKKFSESETIKITNHDKQINRTRVIVSFQFNWTRTWLHFSYFEIKRKTIESFKSQCVYQELNKTRKDDARSSNAHRSRVSAKQETSLFIIIAIKQITFNLNTCLHQALLFAWREKIEICKHCLHFASSCQKKWLDQSHLYWRKSRRRRV
jgi:hypothetical protein